MTQSRAATRVLTTLLRNSWYHFE